jgi:hypothetical protein
MGKPGGRIKRLKKTKASKWGSERTSGIVFAIVRITSTRLDTSVSTFFRLISMKSRLSRC